MNEEKFIAHVRKQDNSIQTVLLHLVEVGELAKKFASKVGLPNSGMLIGLIHDIGKYSSTFQTFPSTKKRNL